MTQESNKAFHEAAGKKWHEWAYRPRLTAYHGILSFKECSCGKDSYGLSRESLDKHIEDNNPDYAADPRLVIEVMREREDWDEFADTYFIPAITGDGKRMFYISEHLIMNRTGKLRDLALEWINKQKGKSDG